jgi:hypothetical protein
VHLRARPLRQDTTPPRRGSWPPWDRVCTQGTRSRRARKRQPQPGQWPSVIVADLLSDRPAVKLARCQAESTSYSHAVAITTHTPRSRANSQWPSTTASNTALCCVCMEAMSAPSPSAVCPAEAAVRGNSCNGRRADESTLYACGAVQLAHLSLVVPTSHRTRPPPPPTPRSPSFAQTPLHYAVFAGCSVTVEVLIECGADPNAEDKHGRTPAHVAVAKGADGILRRLVTAGGDGAST